MRLPFVPCHEAIRVAREHVFWVQIHDRECMGPGMLLAASGLTWPHEREPSWSDAVLVLAAWWDLDRADQLYRHDGLVIPMTPRRPPARPQQIASHRSAAA